MPRVSAAFFAVGVLCVFLGMLLGMHMGETHDMTLANAHAHLNLVGWATMGLYGTFYALTAATYSPRLAWINFVLAMLGVAVMIPSLMMFLANGNDPKFVPGMVTGEVITVLRMATFAISVVRELIRKRT